MPRKLQGILPILIVYLALGLACGIIVPPFEGLDEPGHFEVVRYIVENGHLPIVGREEEGYQYRQEAAQPPLYYLLSAGLMRVFGLRADDTARYIRFKTRVFCGPDAPNLYDNRAVFYHNPHQEDLPWQGALLMLHVLRAWSTLLQALTVGFTYALVSRLFPKKRSLAIMATTIVAFNPQFLFTAGGVNNDNLVTPLATIGLYLILQIWLDGLSIWRSIAIGLIVGAAGLSKLSGWLLLPLAAGVIVVSTLQTHPFHTSLARALFHGTLTGIAALAVGGWWFWRNWQLYGDPTALSPMLEIVGRRTIPVFPLAEGRIMFLSFWGQIPCSFYPSAFYIPFFLLTVVGVTGLIWAWLRASSQEQGAILILAIWFLVVLVGWIRWDQMTYAAGGRLLFPALPAVGTLFAVGAYHLVRRRIVVQIVVLLMVVMAWWAIVNILPAFFAPPPVRLVEKAHPAYHTAVTFGDSIRLLGYDLSTDTKKGALDIRLYWLATAPIAQDYNLSLQMVSVVPGKDDVLWAYNSWPGRGNYPTSAWLPGKAIVDRYRFRLPPSGFPTQAWSLQVILYEEATMERLPVRVGDTLIGDHFVLATLRWPGTSLECPAKGPLSGEVLFGDAIALTHALVISEDTDTQVILCWKSLRPLSQNLHVFVHLYDERGDLLQAGDGPPMEGAFPTSLWEVGDTVLDSHFLRGVTPRPGQKIAVGWYNLEDGQRLPATQDGKPAPDNAIPIWPDRP